MEDFVVSFWLILMIVLDGIIAFSVPAWRVKLNLLSKETRKAIVSYYVTGKNGIYQKLRPRLLEDANIIIDRISNKLSSEVDIRINNMVTNDIPHIMYNNLEQLKDQLKSQFDERLSKLDKDFGSALQVVLQQMDKVSSDCMRVVGAKGNMDKNIKQQKRLIAEKTIMEQKPKYGGIDLARMLTLAKQGQAFGFITKGDYNHYLDQMIKMYEGSFNGAEDSGIMSLLQGSLPLQQTGSNALQKEIRPRTATQNPSQAFVMDDIEIDEATAEQLIRDTFNDIGFPKDKVNAALAKNKEIRAKEEKEKKRRVKND
jgi:hypothetical protein